MWLPVCHGGSSQDDGPTIAGMVYGSQHTEPQQMSASGYFAPQGNMLCDVDFDYTGGSWGETEDDTIYEPQSPRNIYWYSPLKRRWDMEEYGDVVNTEDGYHGDVLPLSTFNDKDGKIFLLNETENTFSDGELDNEIAYPLSKFEESSKYKIFTWISKKLTMRSSSQQKMFYKIRLVKLSSSGSVSVRAKTDKSSEWTDLGEASDISTDLKIPRPLRRGRWIQIAISSIGEEKTLVSSMSVIWRQKPVK
jgi:hypothetical protein